MKFLVTGATGFLGSAVARHLAAAGHEVRALVRAGHDVERLAALGLEPCAGDLLDRGSLERAVAGVDGVFHVAAVYKFWTRRRKDIYDANVGGTQALLGAARRAGVRRFVFTSSIGALRSRGRGVMVTEADHAAVDDLPDDYHRSKLLAEQAALHANGEGGMEVVVVNPTTPIGEGDVKPTPTGVIVIEFLRRRFPGYMDGEINFVDVRDVAAGHLLAFEEGAAGQRYILGGENSTFRGAYEMLERATGLRRRPVRIPYALAAPVAMADTLLEGGLLRRAPFFPYAGVRAVRHPMHADSSKAVRELEYRPGPVIGAFGRAARWFVANGYVSVNGMNDDARLAEGVR